MAEWIDGSEQDDERFRNFDYMIQFMNPENRTLRQVTIENAAECDQIFSMLMGDEVPPRREFIEKNARYAKIDA